MSVEIVYVVFNVDYVSNCDTIQAIFKSEIDAESYINKLKKLNHDCIFEIAEHELQGNDEDSLLMPRN